jgi:hypothetical protein
VRQLCLLFISVALAAMFITNSAAAQEVQDRFQLALSTDLVSYNSVTLESDLFDDDVKQSNTKWGVHRSVLLELGYGVSDMIVVGAFATLGGVSQSTEQGDEESEVSDFVAMIGPKIDVLLSQGNDVRPFLGAMIALVHQSESVEDGPETSMTGFNVGARLGLHWFASAGFSLMPAVMFAYTSVSGEVEIEDSTEAPEISQSGFMIGLMLGASGWI